jgi:hypothetical protein
MNKNIKNESYKIIQSNGFTLFKHNSLWGCIIKNGAVIPPVYNCLGGIFKGKYLQAKLGEKYGLIDTSNNIIIPFIYDFVDVRILDECGGEIFIAEKAGKCGIIDINENILIPFEYDDIDFDSRGCKLENIVFMAIKNNSYGLINIQNKITTPFKYKYIQNFGKKYYIARKEENNEVIIIDKFDNPICKQTKKKLYAGLTKEDFYYACTPLSQKTTGLNMIVFVCPNFIENLSPRIWVQNNYDRHSDGNILPVDIDTQTVSKYYRKKSLNLTSKDFEQLKQFIIANKKLLLEVCEQNPPYSSIEIWERIKKIK